MDFVCALAAISLNMGARGGTTKDVGLNPSAWAQGRLGRVQSGGYDMKSAIGAALFGLLVMGWAPRASADVSNVVGEVSEAQYRSFHSNLYVRPGMARNYGLVSPFGFPTNDHDRARDNIQASFTNMGLSTTRQPFTFAYGGYLFTNYNNVIGAKVGTDTNAGYYIIGGHYDSVACPGADDNASGTAATMEAARVLSGHSFRSTLIFIAFDGEEEGLKGSYAYVGEYTTTNTVNANDNSRLTGIYRGSIKGMLSADMIAFNSASHPNQGELYGAGGMTATKANLAAAVDRYGVGLTWVDKGYIWGSDQNPFLEVGVDACLLIDDHASSPYYHTTSDNVDSTYNTTNYIDYAYATKMTRALTGYLAEQAGLVPTVSVSVPVPQASEWGTNAGVVMFSRADVLTNDLTVYYDTGGTAVATNDYAALPGWVVISNGCSNAVIVVTPVADSLAEGTREVVVAIRPDAGYGIGSSASGLVTIVEDDPAISVTPTNGLAFGAVQVSTTNTLDFTVQNTGGGVLTGNVGGVSAPFSIVGGTSYVLSASATTNLTMRFIPTTAGTYSNNAAFNSSAGNLVRPVAGTATNPPPGVAQFATNACSIPENGGAVTIAVVRVGGNFGNLNATFATSNGTALAGVGFDYMATNGALSWTDGDTASKSIVVSILDNATYESNETFTVTLNGASLGSPSSTTVTIVDDDPAITVMPTNGLAFGVVQVGSTNQLVFTVQNVGTGTLSGVASVAGVPFNVVAPSNYNLTAQESQTVTVRYAPTAAGTYSNNVDFTGGGGATRLVTGSAYLAPTKVIGLSGNLAYGNVTVGQTSNRTLTISNTGNAALTVASISYPSGFSGTWNGTVTAGGSQNVTVTFAPMSVGGYGGNLTVSSDATTGTSTRTISGTGTNGTSADVQLIAVTAPIWSGGSLPPEPRGQATTCAMAYTVRNNGAATVLGQSILYEVYLSVDTTFNLADRKIGQQIIGPLTLAATQQAVQSNGTVTVNLPSDLTAGVYYVGVHAVLQGASPIDPNDANNWKAAGTIVVPPKTVVVFPMSFPNRTVWALCLDAQDRRFVSSQSVFSPTQIALYDLIPNRWYWVVLDVETVQGNGNWTIAYSGWFMRAEAGPGRWIGNWITQPVVNPFRVDPPIVWMLFERAVSHLTVTYNFDQLEGTYYWGDWRVTPDGWVGYPVPWSDRWYAVFVADATAGVWY